MTAARPVAPAPSTTAFSSSISLHTVTTAVVSSSAGSSPQDGDGDPRLADRHNLVNQGPARGQGVHPHRGHGQAWILTFISQDCQFSKSAWVYIVLPSARLGWVGTCTARPTSSAVLKLGHA